MIEDALKNVKGYVEIAELEVIENMVSGLIATGCVLEIGAWMGYSTIQIANMCKGKRKFYSIDDFSRAWKECLSWDELADAYKKNLQAYGMDKHTIHIRQFAQEVDWKEPIALLFHDAAHTYKEVCEDLKKYLPFVSRNGVVILHDYWKTNKCDVKLAADSLGLKKNMYEYGTAGSMGVFIV